MTALPEVPDLFAHARATAHAKSISAPAKPPFGITLVGILSILFSAPLLFFAGAAFLFYAYLSYGLYLRFNAANHMVPLLLSSIGNSLGFLILFLASFVLLRAGIRACAADPRTVAAHRSAALFHFFAWALVVGSHALAITGLLAAIRAKARPQDLAALDHFHSPLLAIALLAAIFLLYPLFVLTIPTLWYSRVQKSPFEAPRWQSRSR